ncbi:MAG: hypothetical protein ABI323_01185 [Solirubrobacteraceae bacterium]
MLSCAGADLSDAGRLGLRDAEVSVHDGAADALLRIALRLRDGGELRLELAGAAH